MDKENIKNFILETVAVQNNRTVEGQLLYFRNGGILFFMLLYGYYFGQLSIQKVRILARQLFLF